MKMELFRSICSQADMSVWIPSGLLSSVFPVRWYSTTAAWSGGVVSCTAVVSSGSKAHERKLYAVNFNVLDLASSG